MTGFGRAEQTVGDKTYLVEIKALNGKQFELQLKLPALLRPYEFDIRNALQENLIRGTIDCFVMIKQNGAAKPVVINTDLIKAYYSQIDSLATELNIDTNSVLSALLRLPEVVTPSVEVLADSEFSQFMSVLETALKELNAHRMEEGISLEKDLAQRIANIREQEEAILVLNPKGKCVSAKRSTSCWRNMLLGRISIRTGSSRNLSTIWKRSISMKNRSGSASTASISTTSCAATIPAKEKTILRSAGDR